MVVASTYPHKVIHCTCLYKLTSLPFSDKISPPHLDKGNTIDSEGTKPKTKRFKLLTELFFNFDGTFFIVSSVSSLTVTLFPV